MISIDVLRAEWTALSPAQQLAQWASFIADLDAGAAGFHRCYRILLPLWDQGDVPDAIHVATWAHAEANMRADWQWRLENPDIDADVSPQVFRDVDFDLVEPPY